MVGRIGEMLLASGAVQFGDFTLASGEKSAYYVDIKSAVTDPGLLHAIGEEICRRFSFDVVAGVAVGGIPIAVAASLACMKPYAIVRKEEKTHGKSGLVIGSVRDRSVLLVEDVTTSGGSALFGIEALEYVGARVETVVAVVDREQGAAEHLRKHGIGLASLVSAKELLEARED